MTTRTLTISPYLIEVRRDMMVIDDFLKPSEAQFPIPWR
jgi:hypothetical protein